jgi:hypothetical protein
MKMEQRVFLSVDIQNSEPWESPRRKHTTSRTWQESEIKKIFTHPNIISNSRECHLKSKTIQYNTTVMFKQNTLQ